MLNSDRNSMKVKFLFILMLSNITLYYLLQPSPQPLPDLSSIPRQDYIPIKIEGSLKTIFNQDYPVQIISQDRTENIKNIFILKEYTDNQISETSDFKQSQFFLINIHKTAAQKIDLRKKFDIYPIDMKFNIPKRRTSFEIMY